MLLAGRYDKALELLRDSAFDSKGRPQLKNPRLQWYALALIGAERYSEAQRILEAAETVPQKSHMHLRFALAKCLLFQKGEADGAFRLTEQIIAEFKEQPSPPRNRGVWVLAIALQAWALAQSQRKDEAQAALQNALAESSSMDIDDLAELHNISGLTWQAMDEDQKAVAAFKQALTVFPFGAPASFARAALVRLGEPPHMLN